MSIKFYQVCSKISHTHVVLQALSLTFFFTNPTNSLCTCSVQRM